jgi:hypothetical protein
LIPLGLIGHWYTWLIWAAALFVFARRHPPLYDDAELGASRVRLAVVALLILILCFSVAPIND